MPGARDEGLGGLVLEIRDLRGPTDQLHRTSRDHLQEYGQVEFTCDLTRHDLEAARRSVRSARSSSVCARWRISLPSLVLASKSC
jgi:hypothetical protein